MVVMLGLCVQQGVAQSGVEIVTGKAFDGAVPKDFYLEGNAIPTEKRNTVLVKTPASARALFGLIDTTGYSSQIQKKYIGMVITATDLTLNGQRLSVGSYGFGLDQPAGGDGTLKVYNQAGTQVAECAAKKDADLKQPRLPARSVAAPGRQSMELGWREVSGRDVPQGSAAAGCLASWRQGAGLYGAGLWGAGRTSHIGRAACRPGATFLPSP
jgi:hypothetical protein